MRHLVLRHVSSLHDHVLEEVQQREGVGVVDEHLFRRRVRESQPVEPLDRGLIGLELLHIVLVVDQPDHGVLDDVLQTGVGAFEVVGFEEVFEDVDELVWREFFDGVVSEEAELVNHTDDELDASLFLEVESDEELVVGDERAAGADDFHDVLEVFQREEGLDFEANVLGETRCDHFFVRRAELLEQGVEIVAIEQVEVEALRVGVDVLRDDECEVVSVDQRDEVDGSEDLDDVVLDEGDVEVSSESVLLFLDLADFGEVLVCVVPREDFDDVEEDDHVLQVEVFLGFSLAFDGVGDHFGVPVLEVLEVVGVVEVGDDFALQRLDDEVEEPVLHLEAGLLLGEGLGDLDELLQLDVGDLDQVEHELHFGLEADGEDRAGHQRLLEFLLLVGVRNHDLADLSEEAVFVLQDVQDLELVGPPFCDLARGLPLFGHFFPSLDHQEGQVQREVVCELGDLEHDWELLPDTVGQRLEDRGEQRRTLRR